MPSEEKCGITETSLERQERNKEKSDSISFQVFLYFSNFLLKPSYMYFTFNILCGGFMKT